MTGLCACCVSTTHLALSEHPVHDANDDDDDDDCDDDRIGSDGVTGTHAHIFLPEYKRGSHDRWIRKALDCGFLVLQVGQG